MKKVLYLTLLQLTILTLTTIPHTPNLEIVEESIENNKLDFGYMDRK